MAAAMQLRWCSGFFAIIVAHKLILPRVDIQFFIRKLLAAARGKWKIVHLVWPPSLSTRNDDALHGKMRTLPGTPCAEVNVPAVEVITCLQDYTLEIVIEQARFN
jgi:hypothetical protein